MSIGVRRAYRKDMMTAAPRISPRRIARTAGLFYFLMIPIGTLPLLAGRVPKSSNAAVMAVNILAHPAAVYAAYGSDLLVVAAYVCVTALLYVLFKPVNGTISLLAAFFSLVGCAVQAFATLFRIAPLLLLRAAEQSLGSIRREQVEAVAYLVLQLYAPAYRIGLVFFGFYLLLIGYLVFRSTFMPRLLGVLVMLGGLTWPAFLWPPLADVLWPRVILSLDAGEGLLILWLLIVGVNAERWHARAAAAEG
jgi:hypothetical protein